MRANYSCIPFYQSIDDLDHFKEYAFGDIYNNCCDKKLLPFQIVRMGNFTNISSVKLYNINMSGELDITTYMVNAGLYIKTFTAYSIIIFPANVSIPELPLGQKILKITDGATTYYSDVILIMDSVSDKLCLKWSNDKDLTIPKSRICYENNFFNYVYFDTEIGKPEYPFEEEQETLNGLKFPIQQISKKTYKFSVIIPEYLADVLRLVRMHDNIVVQLKNKQFICFNFLITIENTEQGNLFLVTAEFEEDSLVKRNAKAFSLLDADFNGDYNLDFLTNEVNPMEVSLTVNEIGNGDVTIAPVKSIYTKDENVVLTAVPVGIDTFIKWVVNGQEFTANPLNLVLDTDKIVDANFTNTQSMVLIDEDFSTWVGSLPYSKYPVGWGIVSTNKHAYFTQDANGLKFNTTYYAGTIDGSLIRILDSVVSGNFKLTFGLHSIEPNGGTPGFIVIKTRIYKTVGFTTLTETIVISDFPSTKEILFSESNVTKVNLVFVQACGKPASLIVSSFKLEKIV